MSPSRCSTVTETASYADTSVLVAPRSNPTCGTAPAAIVFSVAVTSGSPAAKPPSVTCHEIGVGNTGCGASPKTSPENQRLVGGVSPSARRIVPTVDVATSPRAATARAWAAPSVAAAASEAAADGAW